MIINFFKNLPNGEWPLNNSVGQRGKYKYEYNYIFFTKKVQILFI